MSDFLRPGEKLWSSPGCKDEGQDKQHGGGGGVAVIRGKRKGSPVVLLERPFIRCSSCWVIYLFSHVVDLWPGRPGAEEMGCEFYLFIYLFALLGSTEVLRNPDLKPEPR